MRRFGKMNFDEILDFLFHRIIGICITIASTVILLLTLSSCLGNDFLACFWKGCGCDDCSKTCRDCSEDENDVCYSCFGGADSCVLNDCLFGGGCTQECGDCYVVCGGLNYSCFDTLCFGDGLGKGCYEYDGFSRCSCINCTAYCEGTDDPGSPNYQKVYLYSIQIIENGTSRTYDIYENTRSIGYSYSQSGLVFAGYYSQPNGEGVRYTDEYGNIITMPSSGTTIYGYYKDQFADVQFTMNVYVPIDPASNPVEYQLSDSFTVVKGADLTGQLPFAQDKAGMKFFGWTTSPDGSTKYGDENGFLENYLTFDPLAYGYYYGNYYSEYKISLYMRYVPASYDVKINYPEELTLDYTNYIGLDYGRLLYTLTPKTFEEYEFVGFAEDAEGFYIYDEDTKIERDLEVYAIYSKKVTVNFETEGQPIFAESFPAGVRVELPVPKQEIPGYKFVGWTEGGNFAQAYTSKVFDENDNGITLKAKFEVANYTISFVTPNGTPIRTENYQYGVSKVLTDAHEDFHDFVGWRNQATNQVYSGGTLPTTIYGDLTLVAVYTPKNYTVTLNGLGVSMGSNSTKQVTYGAKFSLPTPTRTGYKFGGWFYTTGAGKEVLVTDTNGNSFDVFEKYGGVTSYPGGTDNIDIVFFAKWIPIECTVNFYSDGSIFNTVKVNYNSKISDLPQDPTKAGHEFVGWYIGSTPLDPDNLPTITSDTTVTAKFTPRQYTIILEITNSGAEFNGGGTQQIINYTFGDSNITVDGVSYPGWTLTGWYENPSNLSTLCIDSNGLTMQNLLSFLSVERGTYKLYAHFVPNYA